MTIYFSNTSIFVNVWERIWKPSDSSSWTRFLRCSGSPTWWPHLSARLGWTPLPGAGGTLHFFIYDTIKIVILLCVMIFIISYIQSYFPPERSKRILGRFKGIGGNIAGALLGTVTPFCACSSIPLFIAFTRAGLPLGVTFSFLISSAMVDIASIILIMSIFGPHVALIYTVVGLVIAVAGRSHHPAPEHGRPSCRFRAR